MYERILTPVDGSEAASLELDEANCLPRSGGSTVRLPTVAGDLAARGTSRAAILSRPPFDVVRARGAEIPADAGDAGRRQDLAADARRVEITGRSAGEAVVEGAGKWPVDPIALDSDASSVERGASLSVLFLRVATMPLQA